MVLYCAPVFFVGLLLLLAFNPTFGAVPLPAFFDAYPVWASPWNHPWDWFRTLLVPWLVLAAPLGAMVLRLTLATAIETLDEDYVRTAYAKGLDSRSVIRRHAAPASYVTTASFVGVSIPLIVTNMVLVERVFAVPGFFAFTSRALGNFAAGGHPHDRLSDDPGAHALGRGPDHRLQPHPRHGPAPPRPPHPRHDGGVTVTRYYELAYCCRVFGVLAGDDTSSADFRAVTGGVADLGDPDHRDALLRWLRRWGCRHLRRDDNALASEACVSGPASGRRACPPPG